MQYITTALELLGALAFIAGLAVLAFPALGAGWTCILCGALLVGLSYLIEARRPKDRATPGSETA